MSLHRTIPLRHAWAKAYGVSLYAKCPARSHAPGKSRKIGSRASINPRGPFITRSCNPCVITLVFYAVMIAWLGVRVLPFLVLSALWANFQLTCANYVEHYGLLRRTLPDGSFERCQPYHSWNSNHMFSNWALFHLQRHSDHHTYPGRRYQSLRHFDDLPTLPNGYFGMFTVAYFPPIWFRVMDPRLLTRRTARCGPHQLRSRQARDKLMAKYGLAAAQD